MKDKKNGSEKESDLKDELERKIIEALKEEWRDFLTIRKRIN